RTRLRVPGEFVDTAGRRHANKELLSRTVLTHDEIAPRRDSQVVGFVDEPGIVRFNEQLKRTRFGRLSGLPFDGARHVAPDLSAVGLAATGRSEIDAVFAAPHPFATSEYGRAFGRHPQPQVVIGIFDIVAVDPVDSVHGASRDGLDVPVTRIET